MGDDAADMSPLKLATHFIMSARGIQILGSVHDCPPLHCLTFKLERAKIWSQGRRKMVRSQNGYVFIANVCARTLCRDGEDILFSIFVRQLRLGPCPRFLMKVTAKDQQRYAEE